MGLAKFTYTGPDNTHKSLSLSNFVSIQVNLSVVKHFLKEHGSSCWISDLIYTLNILGSHTATDLPVV